ncbi:MAG: GTP cyclohydrolase I FolE [Candidatus Anammoxibacter sp.]
MLSTKKKPNVGKRSNLEKLIKEMIAELGEDADREGLLNTPKRVAKSWRFLTEGYHKDVNKVLNGALFKENYDEMVVVKDIDFYSMCEHHMLPFYGKCHVAYIPDGVLVGLSKIPRLVEVFSRRLQVQERMTVQIAESLQAVLKPRGVAVVVEASHLCMAMRGIEKQNAFATTSTLLGVFMNDRSTRMEFMSLIHNK